MKRICVIGLGQFGRETAINLAKEQCEVLVIDLSQKLINEIAEKVQRALRLDARNFDDLSSVVSKDFDEAIVSVGENLEASILAVLHLKKIGIECIHAKALNDDHASILRSLGASNIVFPERESASRLVRSIIHPNVLENIHLSEGYLLSEIATPDFYCGQSLGDVDLRGEYGIFIIAAHQRLPDRTIFMPGADYKFKPSDSLVLLGRSEDIGRFADKEN